MLSLMLPIPLRMLAVESCLVSEAPGCALHLLLTLSLRLSIALCTKPPIPLVGDGGRSMEMRFWALDIVRPMTVDSASAVDVWSGGGGANLCESRNGSGDLDSVVRWSKVERVLEGLLLQAALPRTEPSLEGEVE